MAGSSIIATTNDLIRFGAEAEERRCDYVCVLALVDRTAPRAPALAVRDALDPRLPTSDVRVIGTGSDADLLAPTVPDVCVAVMGSDVTGISAGVCELAAAGVPVALVVESALDAPRLRLGETALSRVTVISAASAQVLVERLAEWLVGATDKGIALAANFPFCRRAKVRSLINQYAMENAMGTARRGPGASLPSMTANQARLALAVAAINGQPLALGRIPEVLSAIGAGLGSRMVANKALGKIPLVGWVFQAGFGYLGTQATGRTLQRRFDKRERRATGERPARHSLASRVARLVASRVGPAPRQGHGPDVRLLPSGGEGGLLVYKQDGPS